VGSEVNLNPIGQRMVVLPNAPCSGAFVVLMAVIVVLNSLTRFGIACLIHRTINKRDGLGGNRAYSFSRQQMGKDLTSPVLGELRHSTKNGYQGNAQRPKHLLLWTVVKAWYKRYGSCPTVLIARYSPCSVWTMYEVRVPKSQLFSGEFGAVYEGFRKR